MCLPHRNEMLQRIDSVFQRISQRSRQSPPAAVTRDVISTAAQCPSGALGCCGAFCGSWRCGSSAGQSPSSSPGSTSSCYRSPPASTPSRACAKPSSNCCSCRWRAPRTWWRWNHAALSFNCSTSVRDTTRNHEPWWTDWYKLSRSHAALVHSSTCDSVAGTSDAHVQSWCFFPWYRILGWYQPITIEQFTAIATPMSIFVFCTFYIILCLRNRDSIPAVLWIWTSASYYNLTHQSNSVIFMHLTSHLSEVTILGSSKLLNCMSMLMGTKNGNTCIQRSDAASTRNRVTHQVTCLHPLYANVHQRSYLSLCSTARMRFFYIYTVTL